VAQHSPFAALGVGVEHQRWRGPAPLLGGVRRTATATGVAVSARLGVELFRAADARFQLFGQAALPAFKSSDSEGGVVDQWTPTFALGAGASF
jgi:hypothetical protein